MSDTEADRCPCCDSDDCRSCRWRHNPRDYDSSTESYSRAECATHGRIVWSC